LKKGLPILRLVVWSDHPLRAIREIANGALAALSRDFFAALYLGMGRPSIAPEKLLRSMLLQAFYSVRSERQLMERMEFHLLFRHLLTLEMEIGDEPIRTDRKSCSGN
jgi:transposase